MGSLDCRRIIETGHALALEYDQVAIFLQRCEWISLTMKEGIDYLAVL